jgi:hypothetical protein
MVTSYTDSADQALGRTARMIQELLGMPPDPDGEAPQRELSTAWRENTSAAEAAELANLLRALRKVAGHLGPNVGRVEYLGMSQGEEAAIVLDPSMVMGRYPVDPEKVDYLVGIVVHEGLHQIEWSTHVWKLLEPEFKKMPGIARIIFQKILYTGEDIYVDRIADRSVLGEYVRKGREKAVAEALAKLRPGVVSVDALMAYWWAATWRHDARGILLPAYMGPLMALQALVEELEVLPGEERSVTARCARRARLYLETFQTIHDQIGKWNVLDKKLHWYITAEGSEGAKKAAPKVCANPALDPALIHNIEKELAVTSADITPIIREIAGPDNPDVAPMSRWDFHMRAHPVVDRRVVGRLKAVFANYAEREKVVSRGLLGGKVDGRRLYRAPVNGRCFAQVDRLPKNDWCVCLLMDASGSMRGPKWRMVENTVGNIHRALAGDAGHLQAYAYFEMDGVCMLSRLIEGRTLMSVPPHGQTASGQAIIAAAHYMPKDRARSLLIHVSDGEANFGVDVAYGIEYCQRMGIHLITLGCGCKNRETMSAQYGRTIQFIGGYHQLPQAVERLLKWAFLYGHKKQGGAHRALEKAVEQMAACS